MPRQPAPSLERWLLPPLHSLRRKCGVSHALTSTPSLPLLPSPLSPPPPTPSLPTSPSLCSTCIGITLSAAGLAALAALSSDCSCRLTTRSATSRVPCSGITASWQRPPAAASSHSAYGQCTLAGAGPCPTTGPCHMAVDHRLFSEHCASSHLDRLVETVSSVCGTSRLALEIA